MDALDLIFTLAGIAAALAVLAGCVIGMVVWLAGGKGARATEVCAPSKKS